MWFDGTEVAVTVAFNYSYPLAVIVPTDVGTDATRDKLSANMSDEAWSSTEK